RATSHPADATHTAHTAEAAAHSAAGSAIEAGAAQRSLAGGGREGGRAAAAVEQVVEHLDHLERLRVLEPIDVDSRGGQRRIDVELGDDLLDLTHLQRRRHDDKAIGAFVGDDLVTHPVA